MRVVRIMRLYLLLVLSLFIFSSYLYFHIISIQERFVSRESKVPFNSHQFNLLDTSLNISEYKRSVLIFLHIQKTTGKYFLLKLLTQTKNGHPLCYQQVEKVISPNTRNRYGQFICPLDEQSQNLNYRYMSLPTNVVVFRKNICLDLWNSCFLYSIEKVCTSIVC